MIEIAFSSSFRKAFRKRVTGNIELENRFWQRVDIFIRNPFDERLKTHKLSGKLKDLWNFSVDYDVRIIFYFVDEQKVIFINIGKHDEVY